MTKLNFEQLKELFDNFGEDDGDFDSRELINNFFQSEYDSSDYNELIEELSDDSARLETILAIGPWEQMDSYGGEGSGDDYWSVYYFSIHDIYIQFDGWYASSYGSEYQGMFRVYPRQVTSTQYFSTPE